MDTAGFMIVILLIVFMTTILMSKFSNKKKENLEADRTIPDFNNINHKKRQDELANILDILDGRLRDR